MMASKKKRGHHRKNSDAPTFRPARRLLLDRLAGRGNHARSRAWRRAGLGARIDAEHLQAAAARQHDHGRNGESDCDRFHVDNPPNQNCSSFLPELDQRHTPNIFFRKQKKSAASTGPAAPLVALQLCYFSMVYAFAGTAQGAGAQGAQ
jgi:hypothetical protein